MLSFNTPELFPRCDSEWSRFRFSFKKERDRGFLHMHAQALSIPRRRMPAVPTDISSTLLHWTALQAKVWLVVIQGGASFHYVGFQYTCNVSQALPSELCRKADRRLYSANAGEMKTHQGDWKGELFQTRRVCRHEAQIPKKEAPFRSTVAMFAGSHAAAASQDAAFWVWVSAREGGFG